MWDTSSRLLKYYMGKRREKLLNPLLRRGERLSSEEGDIKSKGYPWRGEK